MDTPYDTTSVTLTRLQLDPIVDLVIWKLEPLLAERGQRARTLYSTLPDVLADAQRIEQVLVNLLVNATTYSVDGDELLIDAVVTKRGDALLVSVEDHGQGVEPQDRPHIFERFYRGQRATALSNRPGIGLAIVRAIVEAHKGQVGVDDVQPHGARFWFTLPLVSATPLSRG